MTQTLLSSTPFKNVHQFTREDLLGYFEPKIREFIHENHKIHKNPIPPSAFVFSTSNLRYINGFEYSTPMSFVEEIRTTVRSMDGILVIILAEVGAAIGDFGDSLFFVLEVQSSGFSLRKAYDVLSSASYEINDNWGIITSIPTQVEYEEEGDPEWYKDTLREADQSTVLLGLSDFFLPVFSL